MAASLPAGPLRLDDAAAVAFACPDVLVSADDGAASRLGEPAASYYGFWNNGSTALFDATVSAGYTDHTLPTGRQQGPSGLADAGAAFFAAFPDGRVKVLQQMLVGDRIVSHLRVTGNFTGSAGISGSDIRDMMLAAVEHRFDSDRVPHAVEHLSPFRDIAPRCPAGQ